MNASLKSTAKCPYGSANILELTRDRKSIIVDNGARKVTPRISCIDSELFHKSDFTINGYDPKETFTNLNGDKIPVNGKLELLTHNDFLIGVKQDNVLYSVFK